MRRENDHLRFGMLALDLIEHLQAFGIGQLQIEQDNGGRIASQRSQPMRSRRGSLSCVTVPVQQRFERQQRWDAHRRLTRMRRFSVS